MRILFATVAAACLAMAAVSISNALEAKAQKVGASGNSIMCPVSTCGKTGTQRAKDVKNCSAANCKKGPAQGGRLGLPVDQNAFRG